MRPALIDEKERDRLDLRTVQATHDLEALLEVASARSHDVAGAQRKHEPAEHRQVLLLQQVRVLWRVVHQHVHDPAGADTEPICASAKTAYNKGETTHRFLLVTSTFVTSIMRNACPASCARLIAAASCTMYDQSVRSGI